MSSLYCPLCNHVDVELKFSVKDYTVSSISFDLATCKKCGFLFTANAPGIDLIAQYYQSSDYISHSNSNQGFVNALYQIVRRRAVRAKRKLLCRVTGKGKGTVLDYGCGTGAFMGEMKSFGWTVHGIEPDAGAREKAIEFTQVSVEEPSFLNKITTSSADAITMWHVLEHVHNIHLTIKELVRILKDDAVLVVAVPNHSSYDASFYGNFWAAYDVPRHLYHFSPDTMKSLMKIHGLTVVETLPMWYDSFYVSLLSEKYKHGKTRFISAILVGLISNIKAVFNPGTCSSQIYVIRK